MVTCSGGLSVKILKRTADFSIRPDQVLNMNPSNTQVKFIIPKKTKLFIEQTIRERSEAMKLYKTFQQGFLRLRLDMGNKAHELSVTKQANISLPTTLQSSLLGFGPDYVVKVTITSFDRELSGKDFYLVSRGFNVIIKPRFVMLPILVTGIPYSINFLVEPKVRITSKIQILSCFKGQVKPLGIMNVAIPTLEEDIEI